MKDKLCKLRINLVNTHYADNLDPMAPAFSDHQVSSIGVCLDGVKLVVVDAARWKVERLLLSDGRLQ